MLSLSPGRKMGKKEGVLGKKRGVVPIWREKSVDFMRLVWYTIGKKILWEINGFLITSVCKQKCAPGEKGTNMAEHPRKEPKLVRLSYMLKDGICYEEMRRPGDPMTNLYTPGKPYHSFDGWKNVPPVMPDRDLVLEGTMTPIMFRAVFADGVEQYGVFELPHGAPLVPPAPPQREGYDFVKWEGLTPTMPPENKIYQAVFEPKLYEITYCAGDDFRSVFHVPYGDPFPEVELPKMPHHSFSGWSEHPSTVPSHNVTVHGKFSENLYRLVRLVDGEVFSDEWLPFDAKIDKKIKPVREGYYFSGWRKLPNRMPGENITVSASMYPTRYRVDFMVGDEEVECTYVPYGSKIVPPLVKTPTGENRYIQWEEIPPTMPAYDLVIRGAAPSKLYTLTYRAGGRDVYVTDLPEGSPLPQNVELPEKEGYSFRGWQDEPDVMPAEDLVLEALYAKAIQRYVFQIDGVTFTEIHLPEGEPLSFPQPGTKDGLEFGGWTGVETDPDTGVITYSGTYGEKDGLLLTFVVRGDTVLARIMQPGDPVIPPELPPDPTYRFEGWENLPEVMPNRDVTVLAKVRVLRYRLRFVLDGKTIYTMSLREGVGISCPAVSRREGYTFSGWLDVPKRMPPEDLVITGSYAQNKRTVTYVIDGEEWYSASVLYGDPIPTPQAPQKEGMGFVGWDVNEGTMPDRDLMIHGTYSKEIADIRFYVDGILYDTVRLEVGETIDLPQMKNLPGETFVWQQSPIEAPPGLTEIHGGYEKNTYTVTYVADGQVVGEETCRYGEPVHPRLSPPTKPGHTFLAWQGLPQTMPAHPIRVTAKYSGKYSHITYMLDNRVYREMDVAVGAPTPLPEVEEHPGYRFTGWHNRGSTVPDYNFTVYGSYALGKYTVTYLYGNQTVGVQEYRYGETVIPLEAPKHPHVTFREWEGLPQTMPSEDIVVSACYEGDTFTVRYQIDGEVFVEDTVEFGSRITPAVPPPKEGKYFAGWRDLPEFMPDHDIVTEGTWGDNTYSVTYRVGGMTYRVDTYEAGQTVTPPELPEREHEVFVKWRNFTPVMPNYDFTCVAEYADAVRHYSFVLDGKELAGGDLRKGEPLKAPKVPDVPGYTFAGWQDYTGIMPGTDVTYAGLYLPNNHRVRYYLNGDLYEDTLCRRGQPLIPPNPPKITGYMFSGWKNLPAIMPDRDIVVEGEMVARKYRLTYVADATAVFDKEVECGIPLGLTPAPEIHGLAFNGWEGEPPVMPSEALTVVGSYRQETPKYKMLKVGDVFGAPYQIKKRKKTKAPCLAVISGSSLRIVVGDICYPVEGVGHCLRNGKILDPAGLSAAIRNTYRQYLIPKRRLHLVFNSSEDTDVLHEAVVGDIEGLYRVGVGLFGKDKILKFTSLSHNVQTGSDRTLLSYVPRKLYEEFETVFRSCGVKVKDCNTLFGALTEYLVPKRALRSDENQLCLYYLSNAVVAILFVGGQMACLVENKYPYPGNLDYLKETEWAIGTLKEQLAFFRPGEIISTLAVGGVDYDRVHRGRHLATQILSREIRGGKLTAGKIIRRLKVLKIGFGETKNRV